MGPVDILYQEYNDIIAYLDENEQPSLSSDLNKYFKKILLLSSASYFEHEIQAIIIEFTKITSGDNAKIVALLKSKAINQQYHTFFSWGEKNVPNKPGKNANAFFSLFGDQFKQKCDF